LGVNQIILVKWVRILLSVFFCIFNFLSNKKLDKEYKL